MSATWGGVAVEPRNVTLTALKPRGNSLAAGRPGTPGTPGTPDLADLADTPDPAGVPADGEITVRLRETDGRRTLASVRFAAALSSARLTDLLEQAAGTPLAVRDGAVEVEVAPFGTVTLTARVETAASVRENVRPPEPVQPVYARYWLHGTGPAPAGNVPVAVHFNPTRVTLDANAPGRARLSVACGPRPAAGAAELIVPDALAAEIGDAPVLPGTRLRYDLPGGGFATWDVAVLAADGAAAGRYFIGARIADETGQVLEDTVLVTVGEPGGPSAELPPEELFFRLQSDVQALSAEASLEVLTPELRLAPGEAGQLVARVTSGLGSELRGEAQLISPFGSWEAAGPRAMPVVVRPGGTATAGFGVRVPATATPGWQSWLLVKFMYFGRVRYSHAVPLLVADSG
jgi:alpha-mannosidase